MVRQADVIVNSMAGQQLVSVNGMAAPGAGGLRLLCHKLVMSF